MEPETQQPAEQSAAGATHTPETPASGGVQDLTPVAPPEVERGMRWIFIGPQGLRAGWSIAIFFLVVMIPAAALRFLATKYGPQHTPGKELAALGKELTAPIMILGEGITLLLILLALFVVALIERRGLFDYNLNGPRRPQHFLGGLAAGFVTLSALVGLLDAGGWLHFAGLAIAGPVIAEFALLWICGFVLVGLCEEGIFRCYLQFTLTRGINFWWALGIVALMCADLVARAKGNDVWGVYLMAVLGLGPCLWLHLKRVQGGSFWQAAWVTSTLFGFVHTSNGGENWVGIFQAALIGAVFCVSIRLTGSAWWAIGCHAGWDWGQTYFYGTPDSGMLGRGHLLATSHTGNLLWSGGDAGPEGSVMGIGIILLLLVYVVAVYGRRMAPAEALTAER